MVTRSLMRAEVRALLLRRIAGWACLALLACSSEPTPEPRHEVRRLGRAEGYAKLAGTSKRVLSPGLEGPLPVTDLPGGGLWLAAALPDAEAADGTVACDARLAEDGEPTQALASLEVVPGQARWVEAFAPVPGVWNAGLTLACARDGEPVTSAVWAQPLVTPADTGDPEPLIVLFSIDTLRADRVTGFGAPPDLTPHLARLGAEGMRFTATSSEGTWTGASHYSMLFSRIYGFPTPAQDKPVVPLAQALSDAGFATLGLTGGGFVGAAFNFQRGFDHYVEYGTGEDALPRLLDDALGWFERLAEAPAFFFLHTYAVHRSPPEEVSWHERHGPFATFRPTPEQIEVARAYYERMVREADAEIGPFLDRLREIAARRPVLLVVVSDHGEAFGEHLNYRHGASGGTVTLHDEVTRVPLIVWGPGLVHAGRVSARPVMLSDLAPSLLAAVGAPRPKSMRGTNLWPLWSVRSERAAAVPQTLGSVSLTPGSWSLRESGRKFIGRPVAVERPKTELYDLTADPGERDDRSEADADAARKMRGKLLLRLGELGLWEEGMGYPVCPLCRVSDAHAFWSSALGEETLEAAPEIDEETRQRLRDLGYLE